MPIPNLALLILALSIAVPVSIPQPQAPTWTVEPVTAFGGSSAPDIALDSQGRPLVLVCPPGEVRFGIRDRGAWLVEPVADTVGGGICGVLAVGPDNRAYVNFHIPPEGMPSDRRFAVREDGTWQFFAIPVNAADLAVDSRGVVHGATWVAGQLTHMVWQGSSWSLEDAGMTGSGSFGWISLALGAAGDPHILAYDSGSGDVRYAFRDGTGWHVEVVEHIGSIGSARREGGLALGSGGIPHAAYSYWSGPTTFAVRHAWKQGGWHFETVADPGSQPSVAVAGDGRVMVAYEWSVPVDPTTFTYDTDVRFAERAASAWTHEIVFDGYQDGSKGFPPTGNPPDFPTMALDGCGNPHLAFYVHIEGWVGYATKGEPCGGRSVSVNLDPDTLNLKSKGKWVTAYVTANGASVEAIDAASLALNGVPTARVARWGDTLIAKFDRGRFAATLSLGTNVVTLTGAWKDGVPFAATDTIRVIGPGK